MAQIRYIVTTKKEVLESLKKEGYKIVGVDGTVPGAEHLYYERGNCGGKPTLPTETAIPSKNPSIA